MHYGVIILNTVFCVGFLIQFGKLIKDTVSATELYTQMTRVNGTTRIFPVELSICVDQPVMNLTAIQVFITSYQAILDPVLPYHS